MPNDLPEPSSMRGPAVSASRDTAIDVAITMFSIGSSYDRYTSQIRRGLALNAHERLALAALWSLGPLTMTDLGSHIPLSRAAVTTLVDRLECDGFVRRRGDERDRRRIVVELGEETKRRLMPILQPWIEAVHRLASEFDDAEWDAVIRFGQAFQDLNHEHADALLQHSDQEIQAIANAGA